VERLIGKQIGRDMREQKITLPLIYAFQNAEKSEAKQVLRRIKKGVDKKEIKIVVDFVEHYGGIDYADRLARQYADEALQLLSNVPPSGALEQLTEFTRFVVNRDK
jgi:octaprenyl-diphosphate synthase